MNARADIRFIDAKAAATEIAELGIIAYYTREDFERGLRRAEIEESFRRLAGYLGFRVERIEIGADEEMRDRFAAMSDAEREFELAESRADDANKLAREWAA